MDTHDTGKSDQGEVRTVPADVDLAKNRPVAITARIGDKNIWIASEMAITEEHLPELNLDPDYIITVSYERTPLTTHHYPLKDGYVNDQKKFSKAVNATRTQIEEDNLTIVNCAMGISRSTTIIATSIAAEDGIRFSKAVDIIQETRPRARPHQKLQLNAQAYLSTEENQKDAHKKVKELAQEIDFNREDRKIVNQIYDNFSDIDSPLQTEK